MAKIDANYITSEDIGALGHITSLDGVRAIAVLLVIVDHMIGASPANVIIGSLGVTIFFVLSGFLITGILLKSQDNKNRAFSHLPSFWMARIVRLFPALLTVVLCGSLVQYNRGKKMDGIIRNAFRACFSLENTPFFHAKDGFSFEFTWSLACEEQFYFIWCISLIFLSRLRRQVQVYVVLFLMVMSLSLRYYSGTYSGNHWLLSWNRALIPVIFKMLSGSILRLIRIPKSLLKASLTWLGLGLYGAAVAIAFYIQSDRYHLKSLFLDLISVLGTIFIILGSLYHRNILLDGQVIQFIGRISYAAYMWTTMVVALNGSMFQGYRALPNTALGICCASLSTIWLEEPIRTMYRNRLKKNKYLPVSNSPS